VIERRLVLGVADDDRLAAVLALGQPLGFEDARSAVEDDDGLDLLERPLRAAIFSARSVEMYVVRFRWATFITARSSGAVARFTVWISGIRRSASRTFARAKTWFVSGLTLGTVRCSLSMTGSFIAVNP
jgi:hypothetical protein